MNILWTVPARQDIDDIVEYVAQDNLQAAFALADHIEDRIGQLTNHPMLGRPGRILDTRELVITSTSFIVPYRLRGKIVEILAVLHGARKWPEQI